MASFTYSLEQHESVDSTSNLMRRRAEEGADEGLVIVADYQSEGHGQHGRKWESKPGQNLLFSILLKPTVAPAKAALLTRTICESVASVLENSYGIKTSYKQPNDLMARGKKICGVLVESVSESNDKMNYAIVGVGLNVNASKEDLIDEAISMTMILDEEIDKKEVLDHILGQIQENLTSYYV